MTSIKISNSQLNEHLIDLRLNFDQEVTYNSNIEIRKVLKNQLSSQALYIRFRALKLENEILKQKNARLRTRRNDYRQKSHQLKKKIVRRVFRKQIA